MANPYFRLALAAASRLTGKSGRLLTLASQFLLSLRQVSPRSANLKIRLGLEDLGRLLTAYATGRYTAIPLKPLISVAAAVLYFLNPLDLVPDALPALGLTDDFAVLSWVFQNLQAELTAFREWEKSFVPSP